MSKHLFAPGDVVLCFDDSPGPYGKPPVSKGGTYRVRQSLAMGVRVFGDGLTGNDWIRASRFRRIRKADDTFTEKMRALKLQRGKVLA